MTPPTLGADSSGMHASLGGVREAGRMHEQAAVQVSRALASPERPGAATEGSREPAATLSLSSASRDLAGAMTNMMKAETYQRANLAALRTADEMSGELLRIKG